MTVLMLLKLPGAPRPVRALLERLSNVRVILVGAYEISEQLSPEQARDEYAEEAGAELEEYEELLEEMGQFVESKLVFTPALDDTLDQLGDEFDHDMMVIHGELDGVERVYISITKFSQLEQMGDALSAVLDEEQPPKLHVICAEEAADEVEGVDDDEERWEELTEQVYVTFNERFKRAEISIETGDIRDPISLPAEVTAHDLLCTFVEELGPVERFFGEFHEEIDERFAGPIFFIRDREEQEQ